MSESLSSKIKKEANRLGFSLAGITSAEPPPHGKAFEEWLSMGRHGQMVYLAEERSRKRRMDPKLILPECRSIVVLAMRYPAPKELLAGDGMGLRGRVGAYACGTDYHLLLNEKLKALVDFIKNQVGDPVPNRWYTDTGPILERDLAQRAGLGWIGRNTCLINPAIGSYFLLAEVLLGLELELDEPFLADRCGSCSRCVDACPTGCILPDRTIDARLCISYLTIENKGEIPDDLRPQMGDWVFGCDLCQMVCPWNRSTPPFELPKDARVEEQFPDLLSEMLLSVQEFNQKYRETPIDRSHRRGYLRNVAVALGNSGDPGALPVLKKALEDPEPLIRSHAEWAIRRVLK